MVFNNPKLTALRKKYRALDKFDVPDIIFYSENDMYAGERNEIEQLISTIDPKQFSRWFGNFISEDANQHLGAWFEIMLYGWLSEHFDVQFEPVIEENNPDFSIEVNDQTIVIEARAFGYSKEERAKRKNSGRIFALLEDIERPYYVNIAAKKYGVNINKNIFKKLIIDWLDSQSTQSFHYQDNDGNDLELTSEYNPKLNHVLIMASQGIWVNPEDLKLPLKDKAGQHRTLREAGYPYIIAMFLEPSIYTCEEVVEALFGRPYVIINFDTGEVSREKIDFSGIHYFRSEIRHKSISGTLVFRANYDEEKKARYFRCCYIENPYAKVKIDPYFFPVDSRYIVDEIKESSFTMKWIN